MISVSGIFMTIILLGAVQGFIVCFLLFFSKKNRQSNRLLAKLIFLMSLASLNLYLSNTGILNSNGIIATIHAFIPIVIIMPMGPLIFFYIRSSLEPAFKMTKRQHIHFLPVIIDLVPSFTVIIFFLGILSGLIQANPGPWGIFIDTYNVYADIPRWISVTCYVGLSSKYLSALKAKNRNGLNGQATNYKWLQQFIRIFLVFQAIWLIYLIPYVIPRYTDMMLNTFDWYPLYIPLAIMIYWLGIKGYIVSYQHTLVNKKSANGNSSLTTSSIQETISLLKKSMEEDKLFLNPNLNLNIFSQHTGLTQKTISVVLNQHIQKSFNEFVNQYRVKAFKEKIQQPEMNNLTIAGVAFECGFNSQATFQRIFKEFTGMSPSEFRKSLPEAQ